MTDRKPFLASAVEQGPAKNTMDRGINGVQIVRLTAILSYRHKRTNPPSIIS